MQFRSNLLCDVLNQYKEILIYGTGHYAREIYPRLVERGLKEKIVYFTQSEKSNLDLIDDIPVISIKEFDPATTECIVLIAVSKVHLYEIKQSLLDLHYLNMVALADYEIDPKRAEQNFYQLKTYKEYCEAIANWYVQTQLDHIDKGTLVKSLLDRGQRDDIKHDTNLIVIICGHISPRIIKIVGSLRRKQYDLVMLSYVNDDNPWCFNEFRNMGINIYSCQCVEEMLFYALQYVPLVYFFEPLWADCLWPEIMLKNKQYFGKIVLALYDVINDGYTVHTELDFATEKYALEHADGIVWRWFSKDSLESKGFKFQGKSIQFLDCCNHDIIKSDPVYSKSSIVKICTIAGYADEVVQRKNNTKYTDLAGIGEILEKIGNREDCVFHLFAGNLSDSSIGRCVRYEQQYKNFKFFLNTEYNELMERLKEYDYGSTMYTKGEKPANDVLIGHYYGSDYWDSVKNSYFDCLSAGLPIITTQGAKLWEYLSEYDVVIKMDLSNLDLEYLKQHKNYYKEKAAKAGKALDIDNQISRLIQFFYEV